MYAKVDLVSFCKVLSLFLVLSLEFMFFVQVLADILSGCMYNVSI